MSAGRRISVAVAVGVVLLGIAIGAGSTWTQLAQAPKGRAISDFQILYVAGQALTAGRDVHDPAVMDAVGRSVGRSATPFCAYNPLVVRLFGLYGETPFHDAFFSWQRINMVLLAACAVLLALILRRAGMGGPLAVTVAVAAMAFNDGTWTNLFWNQMNVVTLVAILGALMAAQRGREWTEGVLLAVAITAKTSPLLFVITALLAGRWRVAVAAALMGLALFEASVLANGWEVHHSYVDNVLPRLGYAPDLPAGMAFNNSLSATNLAPNGVINRARFLAGEAIDDPSGAWIVTGVALALLAAGVLRRRDDVFARYAATTAALFVVSSVTWPHHLVWLALPVSWLALRTWRREASLSSTVLACVVVMVLYVPMYAFSGAPGRGADMAGVTAEGEELDMRLRSAALVVMLLLVTTARRPPEQSAGKAASGHRELA